MGVVATLALPRGSNTNPPGPPKEGPIVMELAMASNAYGSDSDHVFEDRLQGVPRFTTFLLGVRKIRATL